MTIRTAAQLNFLERMERVVRFKHRKRQHQWLQIKRLGLVMQRSVGSFVYVGNMY
jgi:hypothetical protein